MSQSSAVRVFVLLIVTVLVGAANAAAQDVTAPGATTSNVEIMKAVGPIAVAKADAVDATDNPCTTAAGFVDMPGMSVTFKFGGTASSPVIVLFQGEWIPNVDRALIRLVIDNVVQSGPGDGASPFAPHEGTIVATNGFNFISDSLAPKVAHTAKIQWSSVGGGAVCVDERSLIVLHK
jgi:hypothetical protein